MKVFVIAVQCAGKTTLAAYLRDTTQHVVMEMDDEIMNLNGGSWPTDMQYKVTKLEPIVYENILAMQDVIFMDNHMNLQQAEKLKQLGFEIVLIEVGRGELMKRNKQRFESGYQDDASRWIDLELENVRELQDSQLIDRVVDGQQSIEVIAAEITLEL